MNDQDDYKSLLEDVEAVRVHVPSSRDPRTYTTCSFTLIELLVVIAVIGIIITLVGPVLSDALERGRRSMCLNNVRQLAIGANLQFNSSPNGLLPNRGGSPLNYGIAAEQLLAFLDADVGVLDCPSNHGEYHIPEQDLPSHPGIRTEYEMNGTLGNTNGSNLRISQIYDPSRSAFAYDLPYWSIESRPHEGGANVGYLDGHASWLEEESMFLEGNEEQKFYNLGHKFF